MASVPPCRAQSAAPNIAPSASLSPGVAADLGVSVGPQASEGMAIGAFLVLPSFMAGPVFNDNIYQQPIGQKAGFGLRLRPTLDAHLDTGLHTISLYAAADGQVYPGNEGAYSSYQAGEWLTPPTNLTGRAGFSESWKPLPDLTFQAVGDYTRQNGLFGVNSGAGGQQPISLQNTGVVSANSQVSNQYSLILSVQKDLSERWFVRALTGAQYVAYDSRPTMPALFQGTSNLSSSPIAQNALSYQASLRGGFWLTGNIYGFVEPAADLRYYGNSVADTNGYKITTGLGSELTGFIRGEVYGGYQRQASAHGYFEPTSSPIFGASLFYYPTRYITMSVSVDQSLTASANQSVALVTNPALALQSSGALSTTQPASSSKTLRATFQTDYALADYWSAHLRGGYGDTRYSTNANRQTIWSGGFGLNYTFWRNISVTLDYQFTRTFGSFTNSANTISPILGASGTLIRIPSGYRQNLVSLGLTYRY